MSQDESQSRIRAAASAVRPVLRAGWYAAERALHPALRWRAERMIRSGEIQSVLFVCHGNVCRSPYGEFVFRRHFGAQVQVRSAGFIGPDRQSPAEALAAASRRGVDMNEHRSQLIRDSALRDADLIVVMNAQQARDYASQFPGKHRILVLGDLDPQASETRAITDPWNSAANVFDACYERIDRCVDRLAELMRERVPIRGPQLTGQRA